MAPVVVRPLGADDDLDALGRLVVRAYMTVVGDTIEGGYEHHLADVAQRAEQAEVAVAEVDGVVVGCVTYVADPDNPYAEHESDDAASFRMLAVDPAAQGLGAGRALTLWCVRRAREDAKRWLLLHSAVEMTRAHALYQSLGFVRRPDLDWDPEPGVHLLGFGLELVP